MTFTAKSTFQIAAMIPNIAHVYEGSRKTGILAPPWHPGKRAEQLLSRNIHEVCRTMDTDKE